MIYDKDGYLQFSKDDARVPAGYDLKDTIGLIPLDVANSRLKEEQEKWDVAYKCEGPADYIGWTPKLFADATHVTRVMPAQSIYPPKPKSQIPLTVELLLKELSLALNSNKPLLETVHDLKNISERAQHLMEEL